MSTFVNPDAHLARNAESRTPAELAQLEAADSFVASYGMTPGELDAIMVLIRHAYRGADSPWSERQFHFLDDLARSVDDLAIDGRARQRLDA